jgi:hypothetical protein
MMMSLFKKIVGVQSRRKCRPWNVPSAEALLKKYRKCDFKMPHKILAADFLKFRLHFLPQILPLVCKIEIL